MKNTFEHAMPNAEGYFGEYGGSFIPDTLKKVMDDITTAYEVCRQDPAFHAELARLYKHFVGRPSPIFHAENLSRKYGVPIYLKREDLNHTGAHKINHCLGEALVAKKLGKKKLIAETGAGQHGVALATAAALVGLECDIYMGEVDIAKEHPNVVRMRILGANVIPATHGRKTLKEAVDAAFEAYMKDPIDQIYAIGSVVGPHPFPMMVRDFQSIIGNEARIQFQEMTGELPKNLVACVGGGSNAMGLFTAFLEDEGVAIHGVEPAGRSLTEVGEHAATLSLGEPGIMHGFKSYMLKDEQGEPQEVYSVASGLDYPAVGPQHSYLKDTGRVNYGTANDEEAIDAFFELSRSEGIIPAIESSHALAYAFKLAKSGEKGSILINLSGRGDKDIDFVVKHYGKDYGIESLVARVDE
ncbi:tryptophan synthase subunit beta [Photobacterium aphoticum]|uniref:Tryptophan synthase beta chain n=1 Tax=Photobacterium aphoticum TaxID=754436 RepID=A0A0J1JAQ5_9GAMM|nr:tryptophan synthase subunit beta [Photobacterium aphoticum]KLU98591.1 tryptophan synthase subunit beta [Photobacterium aphoticum]PSU57509.1 tryptophan synthase subunit beta [Photobacterium aphoticum]GHA62473.1 tryptophan synthase beta chain 2 [Photobacterium aphoticum]